MEFRPLRFALPLAVVAWLVSHDAVAAEEPLAALKAQTKITQEEATKTALAKVPNGEVKSVELEKENGKLVWSFDISTPKSIDIIEIQVNAKTGEIVSRHIETPADQEKEAAAEKQEKK
jgi:uncharacterized membrane protein YkoI